VFILDSLFMSGFRWVLDTVVTAAEAEMNDDTALREQLLAAELRREMGEISDEEFAELEADVLARIREIKERREGGSGPIAFGGPMETTPDTQFQVEATVSGDFHEPRDAGSGTVIEGTVLDSVRVEPPAPRAKRAARPAPARATPRPRRKSRGRTPRAS
jgi:hypothetical protein